MQAVAGSGIRFMSDSLIAFQPAIEDPSNIWPSANVSSSIMVTSKVTCCHLPRGSVKRKSTYLTSFSLIAFRTSLALFISAFLLPAVSQTLGPRLASFQPSVPDPTMREGFSDRVRAGFTRADADRPLDSRYKNLAIADAAGLRGLHDRLDRTVDHVIGQHDLDLHLRQEIDDVFGAAIELGMALLAAEAF